MTTYNRSQSQPGYRSSWVASRPIRESPLSSSQRHSAAREVNISDMSCRLSGDQKNEGTLGERLEASRDRHGSLGHSGREYVGFATLPEQMQRKSVKRGFEFTLMVVGETGLGKSTLVNSLFLTDLYKDRASLNAEERIDKTVEIQRSSIDIEEQGVRLRLTVVDTPGFGDSVNSENSWGPIISHIESKFEQYYRDESGLNRKNLIDDRIHCCLYFISPYGHGLRPIDIEFMKRLHDKVNIVPIIAKADCLTKAEVKRMKDRVLREISQHEIGIYAFPDCESDEDEEFKKQDRELKASIPFAVIGSNTVVEVNGRRVRGRLYPWGITEVENPKHCDFVKLRNMLIRTHMQDLKDVTRDVHYENYRLGRIRGGGGTHLTRERSKLKRDSGVFDEVAEKDRMLEQKEAELRQMQVMLEKMQREMAVTRRSSRGADSPLYDDRRSSTVEV